MPPPPDAANRALLLPYAAPYLAYVGVGLLPVGPFSAYAIRVLLAGGLLVWAWRSYVPLRGPGAPATSAAVGAAAGLLGTVLWLALLVPFAPAGADPWPLETWALRTVAAVAIVPLAEELLMRGYVLRVALQWQRARREQLAEPLETALDRRSLASVEPGAWSPLSVAIATAVFTAGHTLHEWPAATAYGLLMAALWITRRDLLTCTIAHATTNAALATTVLTTSRWQLW